MTARPGGARLGTAGPRFPSDRQRLRGKGGRRRRRPPGARTGRPGGGTAGGRAHAALDPVGPHGRGRGLGTRGAPLGDLHPARLAANPTPTAAPVLLPAALSCVYGPYTDTKVEPARLPDRASV